MKLRTIGLALAGVVLAAECALIPSEASALSGAGPTLGPGNAFYEGPLHVCTQLGHESTGYVEQNSLTDANCALGYAQFTVNQPYINGHFLLNLGSTAYNCVTVTTGLVVAEITCTVPAG